MITLRDGTDVDVRYTLDGKVAMPPSLSPMQQSDVLAQVMNEIDDFFGGRP